MKTRLFICSLALFSIVLLCSALPITLFMNTDTYWRRGKDIVIARCQSVPMGLERFSHGDGLYLAEVEVIKTLKGGSPIGKRSIGTIYDMQPGRTYLLYSLGGSALGTDFLALPELSVVEFPPDLSLVTLDGKPPIEQVSMIFTARLQHVERTLRQVEKEKILLEKATSKK